MLTYIISLGDNKVVINNKGLEDLKEIYKELDEYKKKKMEQMAVGLLDVQMIIEDEKMSFPKKGKIEE
jgi:hypothetical protein